MELQSGRRTAQKYMSTAWSWNTSISYTSAKDIKKKVIQLSVFLDIEDSNLKYSSNAEKHP